MPRIHSLGWLSLMLLTGTLYASSNSVRLTSGEWPPYTSEHLPYDGIMSYIVTEVFSKQGIRVEYGYFPWKRSFRLAQYGEWDGSLGWTKNQQREKDFYFSEPLLNGHDVFFYLKDMPDKVFTWKDYSDLKGLKIGATLGYIYGPGFDKADLDGEINVLRFPSDADLIRNLYLGRLDLAVMDACVGHDLIELSYPTHSSLFGHTRKVVRNSSFRMILTRKKPENAGLMEKFNQGLASLRDDPVAFKMLSSVYARPCYSEYLSEGTNSG
ncbi:substrate-binding periplasmic protein [Dongshaea marina]|uniref:substrate-binding periplasmic protein n=1 Tax=Dongshaea marina TaxID=2047966 RepID=UPI000D3E53DB|nr:transporter substrate-binding domain-containing protein [Dongshaea marina]